MEQRLAIGSKRLSALMIEIYGDGESASQSDDTLYFAIAVTILAMILVTLAAVFGRKLLYGEKGQKVKESPVNSKESQDNEESLAINDE